MSDQEPLQHAFDAALAALKGKQRRFVEEYLRDLHGQNAAIRAGYAKPAARVQASRMLTNVNIRAAVNAGLALHAMPPGEVLARLAAHARGSIADLLNDAGDIDLKKAREEAVLHLIKSRSVTKEGERIELYDAQAALALLGKHHGLFVERTETTIDFIGDAAESLDRKLIPRVADNETAGMVSEPDAT